MGIKGVTIGVFLLVVIGCTPNSAFKYHQEIMTLEKELNPHIDDAISKFNFFYETNDYDSVVKVSNRMEELIETKLEKIRKMNLPGAVDGIVFKEASLEYFLSMKNVFSSYKRFASQATDEAREAERDRLGNDLDMHEKAIVTMRNAQRKFAKVNGYKVK